MITFESCILINSRAVFEDNLDGYTLVTDPYDLQSPHINEQLGSQRAKKRKTAGENEAFADVHHEAIRAYYSAALQCVKENAALLKNGVAPTLLTRPPAFGGERSSILSRLLKTVTKMSGDVSVCTIDNAWIVNLSQDESLRLYVGREQAVYLIPAGACFYNSDLSHLTNMISTTTTSDGAGAANAVAANVVVIDPPWENKSAQRGHKYESLAPHEIRSLPLTPPVLTDVDDAFVVFWITNKEANRRFIVNTLSSWNLVYVATWYWLKVTNAGQAAFPFGACAC
jgi:hypothetical protein